MITDGSNLCMGCLSQLGPDGRCSCGYDETVPTDPVCLMPRTVLAERYLVGRCISMNGEGITYIGFDQQNEERVFIREFMPQAICHRNEFTGVVMPYAGMEAQYKTLLSDFYDLCVTLKGLRAGDNLVPVTDVFTERTTVYAVYKFVKTISYGDYLLHNGGDFTWSQVKKLFMPLFTTLSNLHAAGFIHRGISPETIRVNAKGQLLLCGFGISAVRTDNSGIDAELFAGYTAPEQYSLSTWQGTWTDVYSIAAVLYKSLTGTLPADAVSRRDIDNLCPPEQLNPYIPKNVARAVNHAMQMQVELRTQTVDQFTAELLESMEGNTAIYMPVKSDEGSGYALDVNDEEMFPKDIPERQNKRSDGKTSRTTKRTKESGRGRQKRRPVALIAWLLSMLILTTIVVLLLRNFAEGGLSGDNPEQMESQGEVNSGSQDATGTVRMPNFIGRMRDKVEGSSEYTDFVLEFVEEYNADYSTGMIFDQSISAKAEVEHGTTITLYVSKGAETVPMPNLVGSTVDEAESVLKELNVRYQLMPRYDSAYEYNIIASQTVDADMEVTVGGARVQVYLVYGAQERSSGVTVNSGGSEESSSRYNPFAD